MDELIIKRAIEHIDASDYDSLVKLLMDYRWLNNKYDALYDLWCLGENNEQKNLIKDLIRNFLFIDYDTLDSDCLKLVYQMETTWSLKPNNTIVAAVCDKNKPDGSQMLMQLIKNKFSFEWQEYNFFNSFPSAVQSLKSDQNIVIVDDFIGTGNTMKRKLCYLDKIILNKGLQNIKIFIISIAAMEFARCVFDDTQYSYHSIYWLKKGISDYYIGDDLVRATENMNVLESKLGEPKANIKIPHFGYCRSESLFAIGSFNIPNNVFPIFWWSALKDNYFRKTIFRRV